VSVAGLECRQGIPLAVGLWLSFQFLEGFYAAPAGLTGSESFGKQGAFVLLSKGRRWESVTSWM